MTQAYKSFVGKPQEKRQLGDLVEDGMTTDIRMDLTDRGGEVVIWRQNRFQRRVFFNKVMNEGREYLNT
jgi:hypothetical protein